MNIISTIIIEYAHMHTPKYVADTQSLIVRVGLEQPNLT